MLRIRIALCLFALTTVVVLIAGHHHAPGARVAPSRQVAAPRLPTVPSPPRPEQIAPRMCSAQAEERWQATLEMIEAGPDAVPVLLALLKVGRDRPPFETEDWPGRCWCLRAQVVYTVLEIGQPAIVPLAEALEGPSRLDAIKLLGFLGTRYDEVLAHLVPCLDPNGYEDTYTAASAISRMKERAAPALPDLARLFECKDVAWAAADAIVDIGPAALPYIERELQRSYSGRLLGDLKYLDADCGPLVPTLVEILRHGESHQKRDAAWAINDIGPAAAAAKEVLMEYALHPKSLGWNTSISGNYCSVDALIAIGVPDDEAETLIESVIKRGETPGRRMCERIGRMDLGRGERLAARVIGSLGELTYGFYDRCEEMGPAAIPALRGMLDTERRGTALRALAWLEGPEPAPPTTPKASTVDELLEFKPADGPHYFGITRSIPQAYLSLAELEPLPPRAVDRLRKQLTARDAADRVGAALALRASDLDPGIYLQALIEGLRLENYRGLGMSSRRYRDMHLRVAAVEALAEMGDRGRPAIPALHCVLDGRDEPVREAARAALARLE